MKVRLSAHMAHNLAHKVMLGTRAMMGVAGFGAALGVGSIIISPSVAAEATTTTNYQANLSQLNRSGGSGSATVVVDGNNVTVTIRATGLTPNQAHGADIHVGGQAICPAATADTSKDGYVDNNEGKPFWGDLRVSLTTSGDTSPNSALSFNRMPVADKDGSLSYSRTFTLPAGTKPADLTKATVDLQGIATLFGNKQIYDGDKRSELTKDHAFETTVPVACGKLTASPTGGAATGVGTISGIEAPGLFVAGTTALIGALGVGLLAHKQFSKR